MFNATKQRIRWGGRGLKIVRALKRYDLTSQETEDNKTTIIIVSGWREETKKETVGGDKELLRRGEEENGGEYREQRE